MPAVLGLIANDSRSALAARSRLGTAVAAMIRMSAITISSSTSESFLCSATDSLNCFHPRTVFTMAMQPAISMLGLSRIRLETAHWIIGGVLQSLTWGGLGKVGCGREAWFLHTKYACSNRFPGRVRDLPRQRRAKFPKTGQLPFR